MQTIKRNDKPKRTKPLLTHNRWLLGTVIVVIIALTTVSTALAQSGGDYDLTWSTVDSGGGSSTGGTYALNGTAGQPDAGEMTGGVFAIAAGFWQVFLGPNAVTLTFFGVHPRQALWGTGPALLFVVTLGILARRNQGMSCHHN